MGEIDLISAMRQWLFYASVISLCSLHANSNSVVVTDLAAASSKGIEQNPLEADVLSPREANQDQPKLACAETCRPDACAGRTTFDCTACDPPRSLLKLNANDTKGSCKICAAVCSPGECIGLRRDNADCLGCVPGRKLITKEGQRHGSCILCNDNCKTGECVGTQVNDCTACNQNQVLVPRLGRSKKPDLQAVGMCATCVDTCAFLQCVGQGGNECTQCVPGMVLVPKAKTNQTRHLKDHGECVNCASTCSHMQCVGPRSDECTKCYPGRALVKTRGRTACQRIALDQVQVSVSSVRQTAHFTKWEKMQATITACVSGVITRVRR